MNTAKMRVSAAFMDLPAPDIKPGPPQNIPESNIFDHMGPSEDQFLQSHLIMDNFASEDWEVPAQAQPEAVLMTSATETPGSSRTRSARRTNQPVVRDPEPIVITKPITPKRTKAPTKRKRVNRQVNIVCTGCHRGNSPSNNFIVLCDGCDAPWHQKCHNPNIGSEVIEVAEMDWFCIKCNPNHKRQRAMSTKKPGRPKKIMPDQTGNQYSENDRRAYLSSLSHDALVQLLLKISTDWPLVPIFPPNMPQISSKAPAAPEPLGSITKQYPSFPHESISQTTQAQTQAPASTTPEALTRLTSQAFTRTPARKSYAEFSDSDLLTDDESSQSQQSPPFESQASQHDTDYDSEDYRAYPEAGQGFQVPMSVKDLDIMAEDEDYPTFSHSIRKGKDQGAKAFSPFGERRKL